MVTKSEEMIRMNKKIISTFILLILVISATLLFVTFNQFDTSDDQHDYNSDEEISEEDISDEIDDYFLSEDDEVEIGEMI